jgi:hypothetical protein
MLGDGTLLAPDALAVGERPQPGSPLADIAVFDGGAITESWMREQVRMEDGELAQWCLADAAQRQALLIPLLTRRLDACIKALASGNTTYLHDGRKPANLAPPRP